MASKKKSNRPPKPKCECLSKEEVKSKDGTIVWGWICRRCRKQFVNDKCTECGKEVEHVANVTRKKWTCSPCVKGLKAAPPRAR